MDTDNYMTIRIHHKGKSYFDSTAHLMCFVHLFKRNDELSFLITYRQCNVCPGV